jgi:dipeptidyl aminopeptidase/acylaminoacyl peptidase
MMSASRIHHAAATLAIAAWMSAHAAPVATQPAPQPTSLAALAVASRAMPPAHALADEDFSRRARVREVRLAPDGTALAFIEGNGGGASVQLLDLRTGSKKQLLALNGPAALGWSADSRVLFVDTGDALSTLSPSGGASVRIATFDAKTRQQFVGVDASRPQAALADEFDAAAGTYRLRRIGADGKPELLYEGKKLLDYLLDEQGRLSVIRTRDERYNQVVSHSENGKWVEVTRCQPLRACSLVGIAGGTLQMTVNLDDDRKGLVALDLGTHRQRVLHTDPARLADLKQVVLSQRTGRPMFAVYGAPQRRNYGLDQASRAAAADIGRRFPLANLSIAASEDAPRWLVTERGARLQHERYWLYDRRNHAFAEVLHAEREQGEPLPEQDLAPTVAIDYRASDGALVHGYLTLPPGKDPAALPLLTMVHGGPWAAFGNDYGTLVQLLANRGYAVFQPNFRSSTGYGDKYMLAPKSDFGNGRVQADIVDGVRWLVANGIGDRKRLGIMGDSFGGYSTLLALTHTPELFQFGMAMSAPPDFAATLRAVADSGAVEDDVPFALRLPMLGIALDDKAAMKPMTEQAPALHAAQVTRPLLIIAGARDDKVALSSVTDYVLQLQERGRPVSLLVAPDEGHMPRKAVTRQAYLWLLQEMLHQHLGGPAVPAPGAELAAYLKQNMIANGALAL